MSLSYNGTTSVASSTATQTLGTAWSVAAWIFPTSEGEANTGVVVAHGPTLSERFILRWTGGSVRKLRFSSTWSGGGTVNWDMSSGFAALNKWLWVSFTLDASAAGNDPIVYTLEGNTFSVLTEGSGLTAGNTTGSLTTADNQTLYVGNSSANAQTWSGLIGEFAMWKRILTGPEMEAVAFCGVNVCPDHFIYLPHDAGSTQDLGSSGAAFTLSATSTGENPPARTGRRG